MANPSELVWLDNLTPKSTRFDDTYYTRDNGLEETRHVFIEGNRLEQRWAAGQSPVIGEFGFGTGLNFLATWQAWDSHFARQVGLSTSGTTPQDARLTFISFEKYPLDRSCLERALSCWQDVAPWAERLITEWKPEADGWQTLHFGAVTLILFIGDAADGISSIPHGIDAWYLDGFNPKTNPELWSLELMTAAFAASNPGATLASYTAAGWVRRTLQSAGFSIAKRKGFGHKRDMTIGTR